MSIKLTDESTIKHGLKIGLLGLGVRAALGPAAPIAKVAEKTALAWLGGQVTSGAVDKTAKSLSTVLQ